jgi:hypothetical protein
MRVSDKIQLEVAYQAKDVLFMELVIVNYFRAWVCYACDNLSNVHHW